MLNSSVFLSNLNDKGCFERPQGNPIVRGPLQRINNSGLKIEKVEVPDPEFMSEVPQHLRNSNIPGFPSTIVMVGPPGSGKTNVLIFMLRAKHMWNGFFDKIYGFGPTVKSDKLYKAIKIRDENICTKPKEILSFLESKLEEQQAAMETDNKQADKLLFIFEDFTSFFRRVQGNENFHRCYVQCRHLKGTSVSMVHKYHAFDRTPRTSSQHLLIFPCNNTDIKHLWEEFGPRQMTKKQFESMTAFAFEKTKQHPKPFLYINTFQPEHLRYRKCFDTILLLAKPSRELGMEGSEEKMGNLTRRKRASTPRKKINKRVKTRQSEEDFP